VSALLFPDPPRAFPGRRAVKICLRALHVLCAGVLTGGALLGTAPPAWLWATLCTGTAILLLDLHESAAFLLEVRGLIVVAKLVLVGCLPLFGPATPWVLVAILLGSVISSHAPASVRHRVVLGRGRVRSAATRG